MSRASLSLRIGAVGASFAALLSAPSLAMACTVCNAGLEDPAQFGFLMGTLLLSSMPLLMIGGLCWYLVRRARQIAADEAASVAHRGDRLPSLPAESPRPAAR